MTYQCSGGTRNSIQKGQKYLYKEILRICSGAFIEEIEKNEKIIEQNDQKKC